MLELERRWTESCGLGTLGCRVRDESFTKPWIIHLLTNHPASLATPG